MKSLLSRMFTWLSRRGDDERLSAEVEEHLALQTADNIRAGMTPVEARRQALLKFGGPEKIKEDYRDQRSVPFLENLRQDTRFAIRQLRKRPGFTLTAMLMLGPGICASVAIFAFVDAALVKPLPYRNPERLVGVYESAQQCPQCNLSYLDYLDWKKLNTVLSSLDVYQNSGFSLSKPEGAEQVGGARVSAGFFRTLGISPVLGRDFHAGEDLPEAPRTVMLSYSAWQKRYGGREDVVGQSVILSGDPTIIIGVLPRDFHFAPAEPAEFWSAIHATNGCYLRRSCHNLFAIGRLKDGVLAESAQANFTGIAHQLERQYPDSNRDQGARIVSLTAAIVGDIRPMLLVLLSGAGLLLLIASMNVASLLLVRSESRQREMAVRSALGGSTLRLTSQFVTEGLVLVAGGSVVGLLSASWVMRLLIRLIPADLLARMPYLYGLGLNTRVLLFAGVVSLLAAVLFAVTPTLRLFSANTRAGLAEGSRGSAGTTWRRLGSKLVVLELATAVVLLVGAGLLGQSFFRLLNVDLGFEPDRLATLRVGTPASYTEDAQLALMGKRVLNSAANLPGVESAALTSRLPVLGSSTVWIRIAGQPYHGEHNEVKFRSVSAAYFSTLRARLIRGRYFTDADDASKRPVAIIDRALANKYLPEENPVGRQILYAPIATAPPMEIIGVVDDLKEDRMDEANWPTLYLAFNQDPAISFSIVARTLPSAESVLPTLTSTIHQLDPGLTTFDPRTMRQRIDDSPAAYLRRSSAWLMGGFAGLALLLSAVGLYGVVAYSVSQRTREIGVRMALGAHRGSVYRLILGEAGWLTAIGIVTGLACSVAAATLIQGLLFNVRPWDATTLATVAGALALAALLASYLPARRAASVNPSDALRAE